MGRDGRHRRCCRLPGIGRVRPARAAGANATHEGTCPPCCHPCAPGWRGRWGTPEVTCTGWGEWQAQEPCWGSPRATSSCSHRTVTIQWRLRGFTPTSCSFRAIDLFACHSLSLCIGRGAFLYLPKAGGAGSSASQGQAAPPTPQNPVETPHLLFSLFSCCSTQQQLHAGVGSRLSLTVALPVPPVSARAEHMQGWHPARGWYRAAAWGHWCVICVMGKACPPSGMQDLACSLLCLPPLRVFGSHILRISTARRRVGGTW